MVQTTFQHHETAGTLLCLQRSYKEAASHLVRRFMRRRYISVRQCFQSVATRIKNEHSTPLTLLGLRLVTQPLRGVALCQPQSQPTQMIEATLAGGLVVHPYNNLLTLKLI